MSGFPREFAGFSLHNPVRYRPQMHMTHGMTTTVRTLLVLRQPSPLPAPRGDSLCGDLFAGVSSVTLSRVPPPPPPPPPGPGIIPVSCTSTRENNRQYRMYFEHTVKTHTSIVLKP